MVLFDVQPSVVVPPPHNITFPWYGGVSCIQAGASHPSAAARAPARARGNCTVLFYSLK